MKLLAYRREKASLTQADVAKALGKERSTIAKWQSQASSPGSELLPEIAKLYGCTIEQLFVADERSVVNE